MEYANGIVTAFKPESGTKVDIIFLHAFGERWESAWREGQSARTWIRDSLPHDIPYGRIGCWGCSVSQLDELDQKRFNYAADRFLEQLHAYREDMHRPTIFVAHSFAGVILKRALTSAFSPRSHYLNKIAGIIFIGTPSFREHVEWDSFLRRAYQTTEIVQIRPKAGIIGSRTSMNPISIPTSAPLPQGLNFSTRMPVHANSFDSLDSITLAIAAVNSEKLEFLVKLQHEFENLLKRPEASHLRLLCLCETIPVYRSGMLVAKASATLPGIESWDLEAHHFSLPKVECCPKSSYYGICRWLGVTSGQVTSKPHIVQEDPPKFVPAQYLYKASPDGRDYFLSNVDGYPEIHGPARYALVLEDEGLYSLAEQQWHEAILYATKALGDNDLSTLFCRDKLTYIYWSQAKYDLASKECDQIMTIKRTYHPGSSEDMLVSARNLALIYQSQGSYLQAYQLLVEKLEDTTGDTFSFAHLTTLRLLAKLLQDLGHYKFAEYMMKEVVQGCHAQLGPDHPYTLRRMCDLSILWAMRQNCQPAADYNLLAYRSLEKQLGNNHPETLRSASQYAIDLRYRNQIAASGAQLESLRPRFRQRFGDSHPATLHLMNGLAAVYILQGSAEKGQNLLKKNYSLLKEKHTEAHLNTVWCRKVLEQLDIHHPQPFKCQQTYPKELFHLLLGYTRPIPGQDFPDKLMPEVPKIFLSAKAKHDSNVRMQVMNGSVTEVEDIDTLIHLKGGFCGTLLHAAAWAGNADLVESLLKAGATVNDSSGVFRSPVKAATMRGHTRVLELLLQETHSHDTKAEQQALTVGPLETASVYGKSTAVELILRAITKPPAPPSIYGDALLQIIGDGRMRIAKKLLKQNATWQRRSGMLQGNPLEAAARCAREAVRLWKNSQRAPLVVRASYEKQVSQQLDFLALFYAPAERQALQSSDVQEKRGLEELQMFVLAPEETPPPPYEVGETTMVSSSPIQLLSPNSISSPLDQADDFLGRRRSWVQSVNSLGDATPVESIANIEQAEQPVSDYSHSETSSARSGEKGGRLKQGWKRFRHSKRWSAWGFMVANTARSVH